MERFKVKYLYSVISVAITLLMLGVFALIIIHGRELVHYTKENLEVIVELRNGAPREDIKEVIALLKADPIVKGEDINFVSKEEGLKHLSKDFGLEVQELGMANPLYDIFVFKVKSEELTAINLLHLKKKLLKKVVVANVIYEADLIEKINKNIKNVTIVAGVAGMLMLFIAIVLIYYTIKLVIYGDRRIIEHMEVMGASWRFIRRPYVHRAFLNGLWSSLIAIFCLVGLLYIVNNSIPDITSIQDFTKFVILFGSLIGLGVLISGVSTYFAVNNYLKRSIHLTN